MMLEEYQKLFGHYLRICVESKPNAGSALEEYRERCSSCDRLKQQLIGMIDLICACGEITDAQREAATGDILETFSTIKLYHAYIESGEVIVFRSSTG